MVQKGQIDHLLQESDVISPPDTLKSNANLPNYEEEYQQSIENPEAFWDQHGPSCDATSQLRYDQGSDILRVRS